MAADSEEYVGILSTDMTKPFESLLPALMINKFKANGFLEEALCLIRSYFANRQNRVKLDSVLILLEAAHKDHHLDHSCGTFSKMT